MTERNSKVRRRIAAGKLRLRLRDLRNLGPRAESLLCAAGISSVEALRERGALEAYLLLRRGGEVRSLNMLWALVGALEPWPEGRDWREVARSEQRLPLMLAVESRESARRETLEAGQPPRAASKAARAGRSTEEAWVPGMPFKARKTKNRP